MHNFYCWSVKDTAARMQYKKYAQRRILRRIGKAQSSWWYVWTSCVISCNTDRGKGIEWLDCWQRSTMDMEWLKLWNCIWCPLRGLALRGPSGGTCGGLDAAAGSVYSPQNRYLSVEEETSAGSYCWVATMYAGRLRSNGEQFLHNKLASYYTRGFSFTCTYLT